MSPTAIGIGGLLLNICQILPLVGIHLGLLTNKIGEAPANALNLSKSEHDLTPAVNIRVQHT